LILTRNPKEVRHLLAKESKPLTHAEALVRMKEAAEAQKKKK
jgi:hypothetical protein